MQRNFGTDIVGPQKHQKIRFVTISIIETFQDVPRTSKYAMQDATTPENNIKMDNDDVSRVGETDFYKYQAIT